MKPYAIKMEPFFQDYIWGGRKLARKLGKPTPNDGVWAESWEIVEHSEHTSVVANGDLAGMTLTEVGSKEPEWLFGDAKVQSFPLLLKYLDCQRVLSVQVHPNDEYGLQMTPPDLGKTEAWYIIDAEPEAVLYSGLKPDVTPERLRTAIANGTLDECLHVLHPNPGDCVFIPAGTVHALGAGLLVAEIQQASNTTFRLFDWNRIGNDGQPRPLHIEQALEVIDFGSGPRSVQVPQATKQLNRRNLVTCDKFVLDELSKSDSVELSSDNRFHIVALPQGEANLQWADGAIQLRTGESALLPAALQSAQVELSDGAVLLDMYLP